MQYSKFKYCCGIVFQKHGWGYTHKHFDKKSINGAVNVANGIQVFFFLIKHQLKNKQIHVLLNLNPTTDKQ